MHASGDVRESEPNALAQSKSRCQLVLLLPILRLLCWRTGQSVKCQWRESKLMRQKMQASHADVDRAALYDEQNIFPIGSVWHAAETGSIPELKQAESSEQARGYPSSVTLQLQDSILQCQPLHIAAERGQLEIVQYLIEHDVDLDQGDGHMVRPLHLAAVTNHLNIAKLLMDKGANPTKQDNDGDVPLHWAATKGHMEMMEMLMDRGSAIDAPNRQGWTALHRAAYTGHVPACKLLLRRGAGVNALTRDGRTALHLAAPQNHLGVIELLLSVGAGVHFKDSRSASAVDVCISDAARELVQQKAAQIRTTEARGSSKSATSTAEAAAAAGGSSPAAGATKAGSRISHVPQMPRYKPSRNSNLDADGFPVAIAAQAHDGLESDEEETPDAFVQHIGDEAEEQLQQQDAYKENRQLYNSSSSKSLSGSGGASSQQPGQLSSAASFGRGRTFQTELSAGVDKISQQDAQQTALISPRQRPASANKKFLQQYGLQKMGLFAP